MYDLELGGDFGVRGCTRYWLRQVTNWGVRTLGYIKAGRRWWMQFDHALQPSCWWHCWHFPKPLISYDKLYFAFNFSPGVHKAWLHRKTGTVSHYFVFCNTRYFLIQTYRCLTCFVVFLSKTIRKQHPDVKKVTWYSKRLRLYQYTQKAFFLNSLTEVKLVSGWISIC